MLHAFSSADNWYELWIWAPRIAVALMQPSRLIIYCGCRHNALNYNSPLFVWVKEESGIHIVHKVFTMHTVHKWIEVYWSLDEDTMDFFISFWNAAKGQDANIGLIVWADYYILVCTYHQYSMKSERIMARKTLWWMC